MKKSNKVRRDDRRLPSPDWYNSLVGTFGDENAEDEVRRECGERIVQGGSRRRDTEEEPE